MQVVNGHSGRGRGVEPADDLLGVGRVGDEEDLRVGVQVGDEVVDDAAGLIVATQRVLGLAGTDPRKIVGEGRVHEDRGTGAVDAGLAEVADIEDPDRRPDRRVLLEHPPAGILDGHLPAAEVGQLGAQRNVPVVQRRPQQLTHTGRLTPSHTVFRSLAP